MKEEFKLFVRKKPELASYVNNGSMTWQKFYEQWSLYGEDSEIWDKYKSKASNEEESFSISNIAQSLKNIDMDQVQKGVQSLSKMIELVQGVFVGENSSVTNDYKPRKLFKKFED